MGKGVHGGFRNTQGRGASHSLVDNLPSVTRRFPLAPCGKFGEPGKNARIIKSPAPIGTAYEFFNRISAGYVKITAIQYRDGGKKGCVATLKDGARITIRRKSASDGSPAVDVNITAPGRVKPHKIHFVKED